MPAQAIIDIGSHYEGSGVQQATQGVNQLDSSLNKVEGSSDRLITKLERPIGRIAYGGLAESALSAASANAKLDGVTGTLHQTFHVLGASLLFVNPELGFLALGAAAIVTIFAKLSNSTAESAENVAKNVEIQRKLKNEYKESSDLLVKHNLLTKEEAEVLKNSASATESEIQKIKQSVTSRIENTKHMLEETKGRVENNVWLKNTNRGLEEVKEAQERYDSAVKVSTGLLNEAKKSEEELVKAYEHKQKALGEQAEAQAKVLSQEKERRDFAVYLGAHRL